MNPTHNLQDANHFYRQSSPLTDQNREVEPETIPPSNTSDYIDSLLSRILVHDLKRKLIEKLLFRLFTEGLFGGEYVKLFLMRLYRYNCRDSTIRSYSSGLYLFIHFLKQKGHSHFKTLTRDDLGEFIEHEQDRGMKPRTVRSRLNQAMAFLGYLIRHSIINQDVLKRRLKVKIPESLPKAIDPDDIKKIITIIKKPRDKAIILLLLRTGMRIGELLSLKETDINLKEKKIDIVEAQKNRVGRVVYYSEDASRALKKWLNIRDSEQEYLFYGKKGKLSYETARTMFKNYLKQAGLEDKGYTLHCLRHTFASELLNAGMRLECLQQLLGHTSIEVTRIYARLTDVTRREEYFKAMSIIEKGEINGHYRCDH